MTGHFDQVFEEVKAAVETLNWKVSGQANEVWWLTQSHTSVSELVAELEDQAAAPGALHRRRTQEGASAAPRAHKP